VKKSIKQSKPAAVSAITSQHGGFPRLVVDGLGNIYIACASPAVVLKYSRDGKYVDRFGGDAEDITKFEPGKFVSPLGIAIDGYGRIFVNDSYDLQVFDSSGKYLKDISGGYYGIAFDAENTYIQHRSPRTM
jgi:hypothetical protein